MSVPTPEEIEYFLAHKDDTRQPNLIATVVTCLFFGYLAVVLRIVARHKRNVKLLTDDWLIICALIPMSFMHGGTAFAVSRGMGKHVIFASNMVEYAQSGIVIEISYCITIVLTKLSLLFFYNRIFPLRSMAIWSIIVGTVTVLYSGALLGVILVHCIPLRKFWNPAVEGRCLDTEVAFTTLAAVNVVTDVWILLLPVREVWKLQMTTTRKLQVLSVFALGGIVCIFGIVRITAVGEASVRDMPWTSTPGGIWSQVEISVGIVAACLPTYRPLFMRRNQDQTDSKSTWSNRWPFSIPRRTNNSSEGTTSISLRPRMDRNWVKTNAWSEDTDELPLARAGSTGDRSHEGGIKVKKQVFQSSASQASIEARETA